MRYGRLIQRIQRQASALRELNDAGFQCQVRRCRLAVRMGQPLSRQLPQVYALAMEATRRCLQKSHYPVQVLGGIELFHGRTVEMQTGEGKTLTAVLPVALRAMTGRGAHVLTANEYLAQRDAESLRPVYQMLGLSVSAVTSDLSDDQRRTAYACDITYSTAGEVGFDFLRDRLRGCLTDDLDPRKHFFSNKQSADNGGETFVLRSLHFALIDEADSILIDDARTPLILGAEKAPEEAQQSLFQWADAFISCCVVNRDYLLRPEKRKAELTVAGSRRVALAPKPNTMDGLDTETILKHVEKAIAVRDLYRRDIDYVVQADGTVTIVDEGTGRLMEGRKWQDGVHHAVEAKERVPYSAGGFTSATITLQKYFRRYEHLAGMTGTARDARREFRRDYQMRVSVIPTHRPCQRVRFPDRVFRTRHGKYVAVTEDVRRLVQEDRPVLIGTPSVESSEDLSKYLRAAGLDHRVLNCRFHAEEAAIIREAGRAGTITVATNMAGRGTDILLDPRAKSAGGLHVIGTELHSSARIDRQLMGRCGRQGEPGSCQFFLSFEDELFRQLPIRLRNRYLRRIGSPQRQGGELPAAYARWLRKAQSYLSRFQTQARRSMVKQDRDGSRRYTEMSLDPCLEMITE